MYTSAAAAPTTMTRLFTATACLCLFALATARSLPLLDSSKSARFVASVYNNANLVAKLTGSNKTYMSADYDLTVIARPSSTGCTAIATIASHYMIAFQPSIPLEVEGSIGCLNVPTSNNTDSAHVCVRLNSCM